MHELLATCSAEYNLPQEYAYVFTNLLGTPALAMVAIEFIGKAGVGCSDWGIAELVTPTGLWLCVSATVVITT